MLRTEKWMVVIVILHIWYILTNVNWWHMGCRGPRKFKGLRKGGSGCVILGSHICSDLNGWMDCPLSQHTFLEGGSIDLRSSWCYPRRTYAYACCLVLVAYEYRQTYHTSSTRGKRWQMCVSHPVVYQKLHNFCFLYFRDSVVHSWQNM